MARYADAEDLRAQVDVSRTVHDQVLTGLLEAASRAVDGVCNRPDGFLALTTATERTYAGGGLPYLNIGECVEITAVADPDDEEIDDGDYYAYHGSYEFPVFSAPYTAIMLASDETLETYGTFTASRMPNYTVTARWGYADEVPALVKQATITIAARWWMRGRSAWSDAVMPEGGGATLLYRQVVDPDVVLMLSNGRLIRAVGSV